MSEQTIVTLVGFGITFCFGLSSGIIVEHFRLQSLGLKDNWNELKPDFEEALPIIRDLCNSSQHVWRIQNDCSKTSLNNLFNELERNLKKYSNWHRRFNNGLNPSKVASIDEELAAALIGLSHYSNDSARNPRFIATNILILKDMSGTAKKRLDEFSKAKIPHYILFGKRKLKQWRTSQF
jgi:hypothetical protein